MHPHRPADATLSADTMTPASATTTSPGIDSEYRKRFAGGFGRASLPLGVSAGLVVKTTSGPMRSRRCPGASKAGPPPVARSMARSTWPRSIRGRRAASVMARRRSNRASAPGSAARAPASMRQPSPVRPDKLRSACGRRLVHPGPFQPCQLRLVGQHVDNRPIEPALEKRKQLVTHPVAGNPQVGVGLVLDAAEIGLHQIRLQRRRDGTRAAGG